MIETLIVGAAIGVIGVGAAKRYERAECPNPSCETDGGVYSQLPDYCPSCGCETKKEYGPSPLEDVATTLSWGGEQ